MRAVVMTLAALAVLVGLVGAGAYQDASWLWVSVGGFAVLLLAGWALPGSED